MIRRIMSLLLMTLMAITLLWAAESPQYKPTELQKLKLENQQLKAQIALRDAKEAATNFSHARQGLMDLCSEVVKENGWPAEVTCDPDTLTFSAPSDVTLPKGSKK